MLPGIGTVYSNGSNKRFSSRFRVDTQVRHETHEEGRRTYRPKCCDYNNKVEDNITNILSNNNYRASSISLFYQLFVVCFLASGAPSFGGCRRGQRYFWILPDACELRPRVRIHFKKRPCAVLVRWWDGEQIKSSFISEILLKNIKCTLCGDNTINHIIDECSKSAQSIKLGMIW